MYRVLIVDDEKMIRMGMKNAIDWKKLGVDDVFTAASGNEALKILKEEGPEIMVTDIQMTEMTGLELIKAARESVPELRVIVLTGFDNFEYARESLRLQVQDFFLKPIDEDDLFNAIEKQIKELKEQENKEQNQARVWRSQGSVVQMRLEQCMRNLVHTKADKEMQLYILQKDFQFDIKQKMSLILLEQIEELSDVLKDEFEYKPKITVGSAVQGFENLAISYNDARYLLEHEKKNIQDIIQTMGAQNKKKIFWETYAELRNIMISNIGTPDYVLKAFNTFTKATESYNLSPSAVRRCCFEIASSLIFSYMEESCEVEEGKLDALSKSLSSAGKEEACEITRMFIEQLIENDEEDVHYTISNARHYIDEHLAEDISVSSIAESLYITPNYFSRLFKRITGEGCNEYIVRKRIEKARSLLETTSIKTGKIAMMVGYRDTNYFSLAFKKHTGKSPTKYREEMQNT